MTERPQLVAKLLAAKLKAGGLPSPFLARDVYRKGWGGLTEPEDVEAGADVLESLGGLRAEMVPATSQGGRPTVRYEINPAVLSVLSVPEVGHSSQNGGTR